MNEGGSGGGALTRRFVPIALLCSLGINLFFAGTWVGGGLRRPPFPPPGGPLWELERQLRGRLSPDGMSKVAGVFRQVDAQARQRFDAGEAIRRQLHALLVTEPFDADAFMKQLQALNGDRAGFDSEMSRRIVALVSALSPEDRRLFADAVLSMPPGPLG